MLLGNLCQCWIVVTLMPRNSLTNAASCPHDNRLLDLVACSARRSM